MIRAWLEKMIGVKVTTWQEDIKNRDTIGGIKKLMAERNIGIKEAYDIAMEERLRQDKEEFDKSH